MRLIKAEKKYIYFIVSISFIVIIIFLVSHLFVKIENDYYFIFADEVLLSPEVETYQQEMKKIDLKPLKKCRRLRSLYIARPCNLDVLYDLSYLSELGIRTPADISDFTPISALTNLKYCYIVGVDFDNTELLINMPLLETLILENTNVSDITCLKSLNELNELAICNTLVTDLSVIKELPHLEILYINDCTINDYEVLLECDSLKTLHISKYQINNKLKEELVNKNINVIEDE